MTTQSIASHFAHSGARVRVRVRLSHLALVMGVLFVAAGAGVAMSTSKASQLEADSRWAQARSDAYGQQYAKTLDAATAEAQLSFLHLRSDALDRAAEWDRLRGLFLMALVLVGFTMVVLRAAAKVVRYNELGG